MFRKTVLVAFGVSFILLTSTLLGTTRGADFISWAAQMAQANHGPYEAPLKNCDVENIVPRSYSVFLKRGYSLEQHKETIGIDLSSSIEYIWPETSRHGLYYAANLDDTTLAIVRRDPGVYQVECDEKVMPASLVVGDL